MASTEPKTAKTTRAYIGMGSNEGDRVGFVQQSMQLLKDIPGVEIAECSSLYETEPVGGQYSRWFVNAVAAIDTNLKAVDLLDVCRDIEARLNEMHGNNQKSQRGSKERTRIIDMDILFYGSEVVKDDYLVVPHPHLHERAYALVPLLEIAPDFNHPSFGKTITELHEELPEPELVYLYGTRQDEEEENL